MIKKLSSASRAVSFFLLLAGLIKAQTPELPVQVKASLSKDKIYVGDPVTYTLEIVSRPGVRLDSLPKIELPGLEVKKDTLLPMRKQKGKEIRRRIVELTGYAVGTFTLPPLAVSFRNQKGDSGGQVSSPSFTLAVASLLEPDSTKRQLKAEKPPLEVGKNLWLWILVGLFPLLALAYFLWFRKKRRGEVPEPQEKSDLRPPWEIARSDLEALLTSSLLAEGKLKEFHVRLSDIYRVYAHRVYGITAEDLTSEEQLELLRQFLGQESWLLAKRFLSFCDWVKFARWEPGRKEIMENVERLKLLIEAGKPKAAPPVEPALEKVGV